MGSGIRGAAIHDTTDGPYATEHMYTADHWEWAHMYPTCLDLLNLLKQVDVHCEAPYLFPWQLIGSLT